MSRKKRLNKKYFNEFKYYTEEERIDLVQRGVFSWVDYVEHTSEEVRFEFNDFLWRMGMPKNNRAALAYIAYKEDFVEEAMANGEM